MGVSVGRWTSWVRPPGNLFVISRPQYQAVYRDSAGFFKEFEGLVPHLLGFVEFLAAQAHAAIDDVSKPGDENQKIN